MFAYSGLEKEVDLKTPDWVVSCGKIKEFFGWEAVVGFKEKIVRKAKFQDGKWTLSNNTHAYPDFILLEERDYLKYKQAVDYSKLGYSGIDPVRTKLINSRFYIEVFGDYWHSGLYVQGLSKEEHQREVEEAYVSAGCKVLILWESEIKDNWDDVCIPKITSFIKDNQIKVLSWNLIKTEFNEDVQKSLLDAKNWRNLSSDRQDAVISELVKNYQTTGFPTPLKMQVEYDFRRFLKWSKGIKQKETVFGNKAISFYSKSIRKAKVKNGRTLSDIWEDSTLMKKCIRWQLENENGKHHANRFLAAMISSSGFRKVSSMSPGKVLMLTKNKTKEGGIFLDPCAGWGGRMLAAHALGMKYIGIDANKELTQELEQLKKELKIDAEIYHGDSSSRQFLSSVMKGRKADLCFTSVPYYDKEIYSEDQEQSIKNYPSEENWVNGFLKNLAEGVFENISTEGVFLINISLDINLSGFTEMYGCSERLIEMKSNKGKTKERLITISKEKDNKITCKICGMKLHKLGKHLLTKHKIKVEDYLYQYGGKTVSKQMSSEISSKLKQRKGLEYERKIAYRLKDGRIVRRKEAWLKSWDGNPPDETLLSGDAYAQYQKNKDSAKQEGVDFVTCSLCGFKGSNISRHLKRDHGVLPKDYKGEVYGSVFKSNRFNPWEYIPKKEQKETKKRKVFTKEELESLYIIQGFSDIKIGKMFNMTGVGVSYQRKKFGIPTK